MKLNNKGFSLVELMVVVAIIGILASVAVPSVNKYMAKSRQSEAKTNLGSLYSAEKAFAAEYTRFHSNFRAIGYTPEGKLRYNIGFNAGSNDADASDGYTGGLAFDAAESNALGYCEAGGVISAGGPGCAMLNGADGNPPPAIQNGDTTADPGFIAEARAVLMGTAEDAWTINHFKDLQNPDNGIQ